ncbi:sodium:solute symporter [Crocinitomix algicola]|uniref:sodium:solute symporter n=1 Tax=Crocinitomix algicola TaxID=1740263 RepID=UPI001FE1B5F9|nr:sodium:solute symporter [Crocinitomix algicola]
MRIIAHDDGQNRLSVKFVPLTYVMTKEFILLILVIYFLVLMGISYFTSRKADNETFFTGNRNNKWYLVAFGMIGASLSGVTFISVPGLVMSDGMTYLQVAFGYILGYVIIAFVLLPLYYRLNLTSIYEFLSQRFDRATYRLGAGFFLISRLIGAALRMYLVVKVLQTFVFDEIGLPFELTVIFSVLLIWVYTFRGGIKTIIWTDTLQTLFMLISVGLSVYLIAGELDLALTDVYTALSDAGVGEVVQYEDPLAKNYWLKGVLGGLFVTLGMTGVDQDMMQKNLTCKNEKEAKKNMLSFSFILFFVNVLFVVLGGLLFLYVQAKPEITELWHGHGLNDAGQPYGDLLFPTIALEGGMHIAIGVFFLLGLFAAAYSSADSALTALTTSVAVDFLEIEKDDKTKQENKRRKVHIWVSVILILTIIIFKYANDDSIVKTLFTAACYTYGPLLGLFLFGIANKREVGAIITIPVSIIVPLFYYLMNTNAQYLWADGDGNYFQFGWEVLGLIAATVYGLLWIFSKKNVRTS